MTQPRPASGRALPQQPPRKSSSMNTAIKVDLPSLALAAKRRIHWDKILRGRDRSVAQWKWIENARNFSIYTKSNDGAIKDAVLAIGVVKGSVPEVASLLTAFTQDEYTRKMAAVYEKDFKHGTLVRDVATEPGSEAESWQLSLRTATFATQRSSGSSWLSTSGRSTDEWCYLDATQMDKESQRFEQVMATMRPQDVYLVDQKLAGSARFFRDVITGFRVEPNMTTTDEDSQYEQQETPDSAAPAVGETRVHFYAEYAPSSSSLSRASSLSTRLSNRLSFASSSSSHIRTASASDKTTKQRLLQFAKSCDKLSQLVRRRRLGVQVLVDEKRLVGSLKTRCFNCDKRLRLLAKLCRVCGQGVCDDCSSKYERESHKWLGHTQSHRVLLEQVRVCDPCLARVENANYTEITDAALAWQAVYPNSPTTKPASADLKDLLQDALLHAPSPSRKASVLSVIRCVLDQEKDLTTPPLTPSPITEGEEEKEEEKGILLTPMSADSEYVHALDYVQVPQVAHDQVRVANPEGRPFVIDSKSGDVNAKVTPPMPDNEAQRLAAIENTKLVDGKTVEALDIICDIAAKELGSFASLISVITADEQKVIGANMHMLTQLTITREDAFCSHSIMGTTPLVVAQPEADMRFSNITPVVALGARYYCGFPIVAPDNEGNETVIGSLCCIDNKRNALNESQFAVLQKLADTASKIVRLESNKRRTMSTRSV